jgi:hypothetical protein
MAILCQSTTKKIVVKNAKDREEKEKKSFFQFFPGKPCSFSVVLYSSLPVFSTCIRNPGFVSHHSIFSSSLHFSLPLPPDSQFGHWILNIWDLLVICNLPFGLWSFGFVSSFLLRISCFCHRKETAVPNSTKLPESILYFFPEGLDFLSQGVLKIFLFRKNRRCLMD